MYTHIRLRIIPTCVRLPTAASIGANHFFSLSLSLVQPFVCAYGDKRASRFRKRGLYDRCCVYNSLHMVLRSYFCCSEKARILTFKRRNQFHHFLHYSRSDLASYPFKPGTLRRKLAGKKEAGITSESETNLGRNQRPSTRAPKRKKSSSGRSIPERKRKLRILRREREYAPGKKEGTTTPAYNLDPGMNEPSTRATPSASLPYSGGVSSVR